MTAAFTTVVNTLQLAVELWAALSTSGLLSAALWTLVGLQVFSLIVLAGIGRAKSC